MYSRAKLAEAGEEDAYKAHHLDEFLHWASETAIGLSGFRQLESLQALEAEHDNLRLALEYAIARYPEKALLLVNAIWLFWIMHGHFIEGRRWI